MPEKLRASLQHVMSTEAHVYPGLFSRCSCILFYRGYTFKAGSYVYVNSPMISTSEWHPFSIIQVPGDPPRATFYAEAVSKKPA